MPYSEKFLAKMRLLWDRMAEALERGRAAQAILEADKRSPAPGDVYLPPTFPGWGKGEGGEMPDDQGLSVVVIRAHPDDPTVFCLAPADSFTLYGVCDIAVREGEPLFIRGGRTFWAPEAFLLQPRRYRVLDMSHIQRVRHMLGALVRGKDWPRTSEQEENEADFEYETYLIEVSGVVLRWQDELDRRWTADGKIDMT
jgi:hypothetical protein